MSQRYLDSPQIRRFPNNLFPRSQPAGAAAADFHAQWCFEAMLLHNASPAQATDWREELIRVDHNLSDKIAPPSATSMTPGTP